MHTGDSTYRPGTADNTWDPNRPIGAPFIGWPYTQRPWYVPPSPCPTCGHCPSCGRGGHRARPYTTWTTTSGNLNVTEGES